MTWLLHLLFTSIFLLSLFMGYELYKQKKYIEFIFCCSMILKILLFYVLESGLKYTVVLDSLKYESDAWNLMKAEISNVDYALSDFEAREYLNPFTEMIQFIFKIFGRQHQFSILINMFISLATYFFVYKIFNKIYILKSKLTDHFEKRSILVLLALVAFYPTYNIWSVTNTKDPMAFFLAVLSLYYLFKFYDHSQKDYIKKYFFLVLAGLFVYWCGLFRSYMMFLILIGIVAGLLLNWLTIYLKYRWIVLLTSLIFISSLYVFYVGYPELWTLGATELERSRNSFLNLDHYDDISKSAFLVKYKFEHPIDAMIFTPLALMYYFFGPFIWEINSNSQLFGLIEVVMISSLLFCFIRGVKRLYLICRVQLNIMLGIIFSFAVAQSSFIGNLGTIFRHRALVLFLFFIIAAAGLINSEVAKKKTSP